MSDHNPQHKPSLPELKVPEFTSRIPPSLLEGVDAQTKWLLENADKNTQMTEFAVHGIATHNEYLRELNGRVAAHSRYIGELKDDVKTMKEEDDQISTFRRAIIALSRLWEWRLFRWVTVAGLIFIGFYVYPYFVEHRGELWGLMAKVFGG